MFCSFNIVRKRISTITTWIQFDIRGCVKTEWQVVDLLGHISHQTPLILYHVIYWEQCLKPETNIG